LSNLRGVKKNLELTFHVGVRGKGWRGGSEGLGESHVTKGKRKRRHWSLGRPFVSEEAKGGEVCGGKVSE